MKNLLLSLLLFFQFIICFGQRVIYDAGISVGFPPISEREEREGDAMTISFSAGKDKAFASASTSPQGRIGTSAEANNSRFDNIPSGSGLWTSFFKIVDNNNLVQLPLTIQFNLSGNISVFSSFGQSCTGSSASGILSARAVVGDGAGANFDKTYSAQQRSINGIYTSIASSSVNQIARVSAQVVLEFELEGDAVELVDLANSTVNNLFDAFDAMSEQEKEEAELPSSFDDSFRETLTKPEVDPEKALEAFQNAKDQTEKFKKLVDRFGDENNITKPSVEFKASVKVTYSMDIDDSLSFSTAEEGSAVFQLTTTASTSGFCSCEAKNNFTSTLEIISVDLPFDYQNDNVDVSGLEIAFSEGFRLPIRRAAKLSRPFQFQADEVTSNSALLTWQDSSYNARGFILERTPHPDTPFQLMDTLAFDQLDYLDEALLPDSTYYYRLKVIDFTDNFRLSDTLSVTTSLATSIHKSEIPESFNLYPNPAKLEIWVDWEQVKPTTFMIHNAFGQTVRSRGTLQTGTNQIRINDLPNGIYWLRIRSGKHIWVKRFVKH